MRYALTPAEDYAGIPAPAIGIFGIQAIMIDRIFADGRVETAGYFRRLPPIAVRVSRPTLRRRGGYEFSSSKAASALPA